MIDARNSQYQQVTSIVYYVYQLIKSSFREMLIIKFTVLVSFILILLLSTAARLVGGDSTEEGREVIRELSDAPDSRGRIYNPDPVPVEDMPGGWSEANPDDPNVQRAAQYAVTDIFAENYLKYTVVDAYTQVVAGINYKLLVDVVMKDKTCTPENFIVYDHFGDYSVTSHSVSPLQCADTPPQNRKNQKWSGHHQKWTASSE